MGHLLEWDRYWGGWTISIGAGGGQPAQRFNFSEEFLADPFMVRQGSPRTGYFAVRPELLSKGERRQYDAGGGQTAGSWDDEWPRTTKLSPSCQISTSHAPSR